MFVEAQIQKTLMNQYALMRAAGAPPPQMRDVGFSAYSQHDEDGMLLFIFALIGFRTRTCVEICCGNGRESNTANLLINHRFTGLLFEGSKQHADEARAFYANRKETRHWPPAVVNAWITAENINDLLSANNVEGDVDLLSIDVDGIDWWLWQAIDAISPRVVITEINHLWGPDEAVTVPYAADFKATLTQWGTDYAGASIAAFCKLASEKGYRLVGANSIATNVIFIRDDVVDEWLPAVAPETLFDHPRARFGMTERRKGIENMAWERV